MKTLHIFIILLGPPMCVLFAAFGELDWRLAYLIAALCGASMFVPRAIYFFQTEELLRSKRLQPSERLTGE